MLHDIADSKFHNGNEDIGPIKAREFLASTHFRDAVEHIIAIIRNVSFKGGKVAKNHSSIELEIVQDADRLDALVPLGLREPLTMADI